MERPSGETPASSPATATRNGTSVADHPGAGKESRELTEQLQNEKLKESNDDDISPGPNGSGKRVQHVAPAPKVKVETRPSAHRYWIRRPQALQYFKDGSYVQAVRPPESGEDPEYGEIQLWSENSNSRVATSLIPLPKQSEETYVPVVRRRQLDIFLDLLWVGIIGNISDTFAEDAFETKGNYGHSFLEFIVLFLLAWQIWNLLRSFLNHYYLDDITQRAFVVWILILALAYGNNAPFLTDGFAALVLGIFLVAKASFLALDGLYTMFFIPELKRLRRVGFILAIPSIGLYIGSIFVEWPNKAGLIIPAVLWDSIAETIINSPLGDRLLQGNMKKALDPEHYIERLENFFIIILGNGVFILIQSSPLGAGINPQTGIGILTLLIYFFIFCLYFAGDGSKNYIHAVRRAWWGAELWLSLHFVVYTSVLILEVALITLIRKDGNAMPLPSNSKRDIAQLDIYAVTAAKWTAASSFAIAILSMTLMGLLNRDLDRPGTLRLNNRYLRLIPRVIMMIIVVCMPIKKDLSIFAFVSVIMWLILAVSIFEWGAGMTRGGGILEPKKNKG